MIITRQFILSAVTAVAAICAVSCGKTCTDGFASLNKAAAKEYLTPIRPHTDGRNPNWNAYSKKFIYAPVFDFNDVEGAVKYRFTVSVKDQSFFFDADSPDACLAPIWADIPVGDATLKVEGLDKDGKTLGVAGERSFLRDFPFEGPYPSNVRPYREAALMAMLYIHDMPQVRNWAQSNEPDMSYSHNTYANKIIGSTVSIEAKLASFFPDYAEEALKIAKSAASFLMAQSRPEGDVLAFFPPTYYGGLIASKRNEGKTMTMDACYSARAFLDLYDATGEKEYYDQALKITDTYARLQGADGSFPVKCWFETGEPVTDGKAMLHPILNLVRRLESQYGIHKYDDMRDKAEKWMKEVAVESFDLTGQFEDVNVEGIKPYQNLTQATAAPYASYLLSGENPSDSDVEDARDLIRLCEDQFVHWNFLPGKNGIRRASMPCVYEQHKYQTPVDASSCNVAEAYLDLYELTGDELAFAKAKALADALTIAQHATNGYMPTLLDYRESMKDAKRTFWINCSGATINLWLRLDSMTN